MNGELWHRWQGRSFCWSGLVALLALGYTFATGPFRAADEPSHFFRAYAISEGQFVAQRERSDLLGSYLPVNIPRLATILSNFPQQPSIALKPGRMAAARRLELKHGRRGFVHFPGAAMHSPMAYLPAAFGIVLGRLLHLGPFFLFYLARSCNAVIAGGALGWGLSRSWRRAPFLASVALFPMTLAQVGTMTADAVTFGVTFCWLAEVLARRGEEMRARPSWTGWLLGAALLSQLRFPYPLLGLLVLSLPSTAIARTPADRRRFLGLFFFLLVAPCLGWLAIIRGLQVQMRPFVQVDPVAQLSFVLHAPFAFARLMFAELWNTGATYWHETVGVLGWLDFPVPGWLVVGITLCLLVTTCSTESRTLRLTPRLRIASLALGVAGLVLTALLAYMAWNSVGAGRIEGWQGRYSLPLLPLLLLAMANGSGRRVAWLPKAALAFSVMSNVIVILLLARASYGSA